MHIALGISMSVMALIGATAASARPATDRLPPATETTPLGVRLLPDVRLRADVLTTSARVDPLGDPDGQMRHRFASSMIDYYPLGGGSGLRVSAGLRFFNVQNFYGDALRASRGLLWEPGVMGRISGVRTGFLRHTPAATVGYTSMIGNAVFGVEVGSLLGNANARVPSSFGTAVYSRRAGFNPIANVNLAVKF